MPPYVGILLPYIRCTAAPLHRCTALSTSQCCQFYTFGRKVEDRRERFLEKPLFSAQNKPLFLEETGLKKQRNPLQRVGLYKESRNHPTPPEVSQDPPQGASPPFHTREEEEACPCLGPSFLPKVLKVLLSGVPEGLLLTQQ